jgi:hypothetical protein
MPRSCPRRSPVARVVAAVLSTALAAPGVAGAADAPKAGSSAESAEQLADQAYQLHAQGKFAEAIATYVRAYAISNAAAVLFNIATIYDHKLHEPELAADYYRRYLGSPDVEPSLVEKANARLATLKHQAEHEARVREAAAATPPPTRPAPTPAGAATAPAPAPPPTVTVAPAPARARPAGSRGSGSRTIGLVAGAVGLVGLGASAAFAVVAKGKNDDANSLCDGAACSSEQGVTLAHAAGTFAAASTVAFVAGATLAACGAVLYLVAPHGAPTMALTVAPVVARSGGGLSVRGGF